MNNLIFLCVCVLALVVWTLNTRVTRLESRNYYKNKNNYNNNNRGVENVNK